MLHIWGSKVKVQGHGGIKYSGNSSLRAKAEAYII